VATERPNCSRCGSTRTTREGVRASELLARIASSVADRGVGTLRATVPADSPGATEFFSAHGFVHRGTCRGPAGDESIVVTDVDALR